MSAPLRDDSRGQLKAWPGGGITYPGGTYQPTFRPAFPDERPAATVVESIEQSIYCKYCNEDTLPLALREEYDCVTEMTICSQCAYGLTPPEVIS